MLQKENATVEELSEALIEALSHISALDEARRAAEAARNILFVAVNTKPSFD